MALPRFILRCALAAVCALLTVQKSSGQIVPPGVTTTPPAVTIPGAGPVVTDWGSRIGAPGLTTPGTVPATSIPTMPAVPPAGSFQTAPVTPGFDPYGNPTAPNQCGPGFCITEGLWRPYLELTAQAGSGREMGEQSIFMPFWQTPNQLFFGDFRGRLFDTSAHEANWGLAYRSLLPSRWIAGFYGFYDLRESRFDNTFQQLTLGGELLNERWGFRINGYIPDDRAKSAPATTFLSGGNIVVRAGQERAYWGIDAEIEALLFRFRGNWDGELRGYATGFYFDNKAAGFPQIAGPRARLELRMYDLQLLGIDSRLVFGAEYQWDNVRGSEITGTVNVRIPFGPGPGRRGIKMNALRRRMVAPIRRDVDIVTNSGFGPEEPAIIAATGQLANNVTVINAATANPANALATGTGIVTLEGNITPTATMQLQPNQFVGGRFQVIGQNSGAVATYGGTATVNDPTNTIDVVTMGNGSDLVGTRVRGGINGVNATGAANFAIRDNDIRGASGGNPLIDGNGILVNGNMASGEITGNTLGSNQFDGLFVNGNLSGGVISNNLATGNGAGANGNGYNIAGNVSSAFTGNSATNNGIDGIFIGGNVDAGGVVSNNSATGNATNGFTFGNVNNGGVFSDNKAINNTGAGYAGGAVNPGGTAVNNTGSGNTPTASDTFP